MSGRRRPSGRERPGPAGFLVVDKPRGWTSHDVVEAVRRRLGTRRVGHLGTLDPLATGVLPLAVREATKLVPFLEQGGKSYAGTIRLGLETDTLDAEGRVVRRHEGPYPDEAAVRAGLVAFTGEIEQLPPMFSAVKRGGVPLHRLARQGQEVERAPKRVRIERFELVKYCPPDVEIEVDWEKDVREDTFRSRGAGGQHVNKTSSAIRLTHIPTGIVVQCQNERSQHQNRAQARKMLAAKLYQREVAKRDEELAKMYSEKGEIAFGSQIRSYVLYPYQLVRDERTDLKVPNADRVLDGDIQEFIDAYLRHRLAKQR